MKILFYAIDGIGLGHINRTVAIAKEIRNMKPDAQILFMTNSDFTDFFEKNEFPYVKLPRHWKTLTSQLDHMTKTIDTQDFDSIFESVVRSYNPNLIVYDTGGISKPLIKKISMMGIKNVLISRKERDESFLHYFKKDVVEKFDLIVLPHSKSEFERIGVSKEVKDIVYSKPFFFTGPIVRLPEFGYKEIEVDYDIDKEDFLVLILTGGGGSLGTKNFITTAVDACRQLKKEISKLKCIAITGPLFNEQLDVKEDFITIKKFEPEILALMKRSNLIVSFAGYNTCNEICITKTPAILVASDKPTESQHERGLYLERMGVARLIKRPNLMTLKKNVLDFYKNKKMRERMKRSFSRVDLKIGNRKIAKKIIELIDDTAEIRVGTAEQCKKEIDEYKKSNFKKIIFYDVGSEIDDILNALEYAKYKGFDSILLQSEKLADRNFCEEAINVGASAFMVLIRNKNSFKTIKNLIDLEQYVTVNVPVTKSNYKKISEIVKSLIKLKVFQIQLTVKDVSHSLIEPYLTEALNIRLNPENWFVQIYATDTMKPQFVDWDGFSNRTVSFYRTRTSELNDKINILKRSETFKKWEEMEGDIKALEKRKEEEWSSVNSLKDEINEILEKLEQIKESKSARKVSMIDQKIRKLEDEKNNFYSNRIKPMQEMLKEFNEKITLLRPKGVARIEQEIKELEIQRGSEWQRIKPMDDELRLVNKTLESLRPKSLIRIENEIRELENKRNEEWQRIKPMDDELRKIKHREIELLKKNRILEMWNKIYEERQKLEKLMNEQFVNVQLPMKKEIGKLLETRELILKGKMKGFTNELDSKINYLEQRLSTLWQNESAPIEKNINLLIGRQSMLLENKGLIDVWEDIERRKRELEEKINSEISTKIGPLDKKIDELRINQEKILRKGELGIRLNELESRKKELESRISSYVETNIRPLEKKIDELKIKRDKILRKGGLNKKLKILEREKNKLENKIQMLEAEPIVKGGKTPSYLEDPYKIAVPWEEKFVKKNKK